VTTGSVGDHGHVCCTGTGFVSLARTRLAGLRAGEHGTQSDLTSGRINAVASHIHGFRTGQGNGFCAWCARGGRARTPGILLGQAKEPFHNHSLEKFGIDMTPTAIVCKIDERLGKIRLFSNVGLDSCIVRVEEP
jgi:hypothetical protein